MNLRKIEPLVSAPRVVVLMGISGSGKSTIGQQLAARLRWPFYDGDDFHSAENVAKMSQGVPLDDDDRRPWLQAMRDELTRVLASGGHAVLAASLLKQQYRDLILSGLSDTRLVYLQADPLVIEERLKNRQGHFFESRLLASQLEILEKPEDASVVSVNGPTASVVARIVDELALPS
jgi:gluconokinase